MFDVFDFMFQTALCIAKNRKYSAFCKIGISTILTTQIVLICFLTFGCQDIMNSRDLQTPSNRLVGHWKGENASVEFYFGPKDEYGMGFYIQVDEEGNANKQKYRLHDEVEDGVYTKISLEGDGFHFFGVYDINSDMDGMSFIMSDYYYDSEVINLKCIYVDSASEPQVFDCSEQKSGLLLSKKNLQRISIDLTTLDGFWPSISKTPGRLMCSEDAFTFHPDYLTSPLNKTHDSSYAIDDNSYIYFGYLFVSPEDVDFFLTVYKDFLRGDCALEKDIVENATGKKILRLRKGIEHLIENDDSNPKESHYGDSTIPVVLERRSFYDDSTAPVLFLDGHVDKVAPGENAVIDRIFELLPEFDALKENK